MGLREAAEADLAGILEDSANGFGYSLILTDPDGKSVNITGFSNDIAFVIDPDTGTAITGRSASVALRVSTVLASFTTLPTAVANKLKKPWLMEFTDLNGQSYIFKVQNGHPDRTLGVITCMLELYND